ncbi:MAG: acyl-ACP--UDP-N-acetylglucosamine O-acyltransferase [Proteobacteria bacterium]|nr:acyl-ACP--UDP-N-acetylglucosamine O-acyltransferase [Pseudomonadota bacterium]
MIHPTAIIDESATVATGACIGPYTVIGGDVEIGEGTWIGPHVVINGPTRIGRDNKIFQFNSIGDVPQDKKYEGEVSSLVIGDRNTIREYCTLNRGTKHGGGITHVGSDNWIMAYVHIAHDCQVGNDIIMANNATLAGHVTIGDHAILGGFTLVHQFCDVGTHCFSAMGTAIGKDVPPYVLVAGQPASPRGLNSEGLKRHGFDSDTLELLRKAYKTVYRSGLKAEEAIEQLNCLGAHSPEIQAMAEFIRTSTRGIVR